jgi:hypothetical protein
MSAARLSRSDFVAAGLLFLAAFTIYGIGASRLGFYTDDNGWLYSLPQIRTPQELWDALRIYMPGRNLHPLWHYLFYQTTGNDPIAHLGLLHLWQTTMDGLVTAFFFLLLRLLYIPAPAAVLASALFAFWPLHGETHFWLESLPMNLVSTWFLLLFAMTTLALVRGRSQWWLWALDGLAFFCALFTYDQVLLLLAMLAGVRLLVVWLERRPDRLAFLMCHAPYLAAGLFCVWLRLARGGGPLPRAGPALREALGVNLVHTYADTFGHLGRQRVADILANATFTDWLLSGIVAALLALLAFRLGRESPAARPPSRLRPWHVAGLALLAAVLAYVPAWLWYLSPRHHFLPSAGWLAAVAVLLGGLWRLLGRPAPQGIFLACIAALIAVQAAAARGESRFWEAAYAAKRDMLLELEHAIAGKPYLVLENFPNYHGPALLLSALDATYGPRLLARSPARLHPNLRGFLGSAPAGEGLFLSAHLQDGPETFFYSDGSDALVVRFLGWQDRRFRYVTNPDLPAPYDLSHLSCQPGADSFSLGRAEARYERDHLFLDLDYAAPLKAGARLVLLLHFFHWDRFEVWGEPDNRLSRIAWPVLLTGPAANDGVVCSQALRLHGFPKTSRLHLEFYASLAGRLPVLLGRKELAIDP